MYPLDGQLRVDVTSNVSGAETGGTIWTSSLPQSGPVLSARLPAPMGTIAGFTAEPAAGEAAEMTPAESART